MLAVHPDDETLGAGGLMQQALAANASVKVIFVTDGENNPWPQRVLEKRWNLSRADRMRWGRRRDREAISALAVLGMHEAQTVFLGLPDQGLTAMLANGDQSIIDSIADEIVEWRPTLLLSPALADRHPDHNALAVMVELAMTRLVPYIAAPAVLTYLIHGHTLASSPYILPLTQQQQDLKRQAILAHETQMILSRQRFLKYGAAQERFFSMETARRYYPQHPIEEAVTTDRMLKVRIRLTTFDRIATKPLLYIIGKHASQTLRTRFPLKTGKVAIYDYASNTQVGYANVRISGSIAKADIPLSLLGGAESVFLKLERSLGFFDAAGWREVNLRLAPAKVAVDTVGIIPCYDVAEYCEQVIQQALNCLDHVIVIDDGSSDGTAQILARLAAQSPDKITVVTFVHNRGKGVALMAGFCEALNRFNFITLLTLDADGQHPCQDIPHLVKKIVSGAEMAIGERQLRLMPGRSRLGNTLATGALRWLYPQSPTDTQSGMRAFTQEFVEDIVRLVPGSRYETEFQILLLALSRKRRIATVSIPTIYIDNNRSSKFRPVTDSLRIMRALIHWRIRNIIPAKTT